MPFALLRAYSFLNRFGSLRRVNSAFRGVMSPCFVERRLFGYRMLLDVSRSSVQQLLLIEGERFVEERFLIRRLLRPGMTVVDVGANIGYYLLMFEQNVGREGMVICVEPSAENLPELRRNVEINQFGNVELHDIAIGAATGTVGLHSGINSGVTDAGGGTYQVPLRPLEDIIRDRHIDLLKIDVEGYEDHVLEGAWEIVKRDRPVIFLEVHPHIIRTFGRSTKALINRLRSCYGRLTFLEKIPPERESLWHKFCVRYLGKDPLVPVADQQSYLELYEGNPQAHTFWVVAADSPGDPGH